MLTLALQSCLFLLFYCVAQIPVSLSCNANSHTRSIQSWILQLSFAIYQVSPFLTVVDIAGLVKGASKGEGLGKADSWNEMLRSSLPMGGKRSQFGNSRMVELCVRIPSYPEIFYNS